MKVVGKFKYKYPAQSGNLMLMRIMLCIGSGVGDWNIEFPSKPGLRSTKIETCHQLKEIEQSLLKGAYA